MAIPTDQPIRPVKPELLGKGAGWRLSAGEGEGMANIKAASEHPPADQAQREKQAEPGKRSFFLRGEPEEHGEIKDPTGRAVQRFPARAAQTQ
jgi:hypothetical protein